MVACAAKVNPQPYVPLFMCHICIMRSLSSGSSGTGWRNVPACDGVWRSHVSGVRTLRLELDNREMMRSRVSHADVALRFW